MIYSNISGKQLRQWREDNGWQRSLLAVRLGVSTSAIWKWEQDTAEVPYLITLACASLQAKLPAICNSKQV